MNRLQGIRELVLQSDEPDRMVAFYEGVGLRVLAREGERTWLAIGEASRLGIWRPGEMEHRDRGGRHVHFAIGVGTETIDRLADRLREAGSEVEGPITHEGGDRSIYLFDPEGNRLELWDYFEREDGAGGPPDAG